jgi:SAM-dependent methyltransferase
MNEYHASTYGDRISDVYDLMHPDPDPGAVDLLAELAGGGLALELGIGTGRIALPLASRGVEVHGVDSSEAMVAKLRAKPGGADIPVTIGDFTDFELGRKYQLVFVAFNTFFAVKSQEAQIQCFNAAARHLKPGGRFLIQAFVPDPSRFDRGQRIAVRDINPNSAVLEVAQHDPVRQQVRSHLIHLTEAGLQLYPVQLRYAWPSELDLMARLAGLSLSQRWADWTRGPFQASSGFHISVYQADSNGG